MEWKSIVSFGKYDYIYVCACAVNVRQRMQIIGSLNNALRYLSKIRYRCDICYSLCGIRYAVWYAVIVIRCIHMQYSKF